jgi:hypothetical protein
MPLLAASCCPVGSTSIDRPTIDRPTIDRPTIDRPTINRPTIDRPTINRPIYWPNFYNIDPRFIDHFETSNAVFFATYLLQAYFWG